MKWTEDDRIKLVKLIHEKRPYVYIADVLGRTVPSVSLYAQKNFSHDLQAAKKCSTPSKPSSGSVSPAAKPSAPKKNGRKSTLILDQPPSSIAAQPSHSSSNAGLLPQYAISRPSSSAEAALSRLKGPEPESPLKSRLSSHRKAPSDNETERSGTEDLSLLDEDTLVSSDEDNFLSLSSGEDTIADYSTETESTEVEELSPRDDDYLASSGDDNSAHFKSETEDIDVDFLVDRDPLVEIPEANPSHDSEIIYIIMYPSPLLVFQPNTATLTKVGRTTWSELNNRMQTTTCKGLRHILELKVANATSVASCEALKREIGRVDRSTPLSFSSEESAMIAGVVAVFELAGDQKEAEDLETLVRRSIGGSLNGKMQLQMKEIVRLCYKHGELNSTEMIVTDLKLMAALRLKWLGGHIRDNIGFAKTIAELCPQSPMQLFALPPAVPIGFRFTRLTELRDRKAEAQGAGRHVVRINHFRLHCGPDNPEYTRFCAHPLKHAHPTETSVTYSRDSTRPDRPQDVCSRSYGLVGEARRWPTLNQDSSEASAQVKEASAQAKKSE